MARLTPVRSSLSFRQELNREEKGRAGRSRVLIVNGIGAAAQTGFGVPRGSGNREEIRFRGRVERKESPRNTRPFFPFSFRAVAPASFPRHSRTPSAPGVRSSIAAGPLVRTVITDFESRPRILRARRESRVAHPPFLPFPSPFSHSCFPSHFPLSSSLPFQARRKAAQATRGIRTAWK